MQVTADVGDLDAGLIFEQDPVQIIDALLPLYLNSTLLRSLQVGEPFPRCGIRVERDIGSRRVVAGHEHCGARVVIIIVLRAGVARKRARGAYECHEQRFRQRFPAEEVAAHAVQPRAASADYHGYHGDRERCQRIRSEP